jgi:long-chain fatty acid transport protein
VAFDSSSVDSANRTVTLPMGRAYRFGLGAQYQLRPNLNVGASYTFMWAGDMTVDQGADLSVRGRVSGSYENSWFSIASLNLTWKF